MTRTLFRLAPYAAAACTFLAPTAHALPVVFQFSGTVRETILFNEFGQATYDYSRSGQAVEASFFVETDGLTPFRYTQPDATALYLEDRRDAIEWITSSLSIGNEYYAIDAYGGDGGSLSVLDSSGPVSCGPGCSWRTPDQFSISDFSTESLEAEYQDGVFRSQTLQLGWYDLDDPFNPRDWITLTPDFGVEDILSLPIGPTFFSSFYENWESCADFICSQTASRNTVFNITSVSRTVLAVSEPGALGLLALGFAALIAPFSIRRVACAVRG